MTILPDTPDKVTWTVAAVFAAPCILLAIFTAVVFTGIAVLAWCFI